MKKVFSLLLVLMASIGVQAQMPPIMVCNPSGDQCAPYYTLNEAYAACNSGDFIYLPGGTFSLTDTIAKQVHIIGAGICPDSTQATGTSVIGGSISINSSGSGSTFSGIYVLGIQINGIVNNLSISKSHIMGISCNLDSKLNNSVLMQSVFGTVYMGNSTAVPGEGNMIKNSIFNGVCYNTTSSTISNCILGGYITNGCGSGMCNNIYPSCVSGISYSTIANSILRIHVGSQCNVVNTGNTMLNSLLRGPSTGTCNYNPVNLNNGVTFQSGNHFSQPDSSMFVNADWNAFSWEKDYSLPPTSPGHNGGTDGTDIGIFGGDTPWNVIPSNPHIYFKNISGATNAAGDLPVEIKVRSGN